MGTITGSSPPGSMSATTATTGGPSGPEPAGSKSLASEVRCYPEAKTGGMKGEALFPFCGMISL